MNWALHSKSEVRGQNAEVKSLGFGILEHSQALLPSGFLVFTSSF
jgi:hypothetical protein